MSRNTNKEKQKYHKFKISVKIILFTHLKLNVHFHPRWIKSCFLSLACLGSISCSYPPLPVKETRLTESNQPKPEGSISPLTFSFLWRAITRLNYSLSKRIKCLLETIFDKFIVWVTCWAFYWMLSFKQRLNNPSKNWILFSPTLSKSKLSNVYTQNSHTMCSLLYP